MSDRGRSRNRSFGNEILFSNILMIILSLVAMIVSIMLILGLISRLFEEDYKSLKNIDEHAYDLQTLLNSASFEDEEQTVEKLKQIIPTYGYNLLIQKDQAVLYTDFSMDERWLLRGMAFTTLRNSEGKSRILQSLYRTVVYDSYLTREGMYEVVAVAPPTMINDKWPFFSVVAVVVLIFLLVLVVVVFVVCYLFAKSRVKRIMVPIGKLSDAARRVEKGNYSEPIYYSGSNELAEVCDAFNEMQTHLKEEAERSQAYEKMRAAMIAGISHDLRTPLTTVKGYIKGILDGIADTPEKQRMYLNTAYNKTSTMDRLLEQFFLFSKLETGNMPFHMAPADMKKFLQHYFQDYGDDAAQRGCLISLEFHADSTLLLMDADQMTRVMNNLIENSIAYKDKEEVRVTVSLFDSGDHLNVTVRDNGPGVTDQQLEHVFDTYYRGMGTNASQTEGSGLGLAIVKYIVEAHKGHVAADNRNGFGVTMSLPLLNGGTGEESIDHRG